MALQNSTFCADGGGLLSFGTLTAATLGGLMSNYGGTLTLANENGVGVALSVGNNNASTTFSGSFFGGTDSALIKVGSGTLTFSPQFAHTYTGLTTVSGGVLAYGANNVLYSGTVTVSGGTLAMNGYSDSVGAVTLTSGAINNGTLTSTSGFVVQSGSASTILAGSVGLTKTTTGTVTLSGVNTYTGLTTVSGGSLSTLVLNTNASWTPVLSGGGANVQSGQMVFNYASGTSPYSTINSILATSCGGDLSFSQANGGKIYSSTALANGMALGCADLGVIGSSNQVVVRYTFFGDADCDGVVTPTDLGLLLGNLGSTDVGWMGGDFDYDGTVTPTDLGLLLGNLGSSLAGTTLTISNSNIDAADLALLWRTASALLRSRFRSLARWFFWRWGLWDCLSTRVAVARESCVVNEPQSAVTWRRRFRCGESNLVQQMPDEMAVAAAVAEIDRHAHRQPNHQPQPRVEGQEQH